MATLFMLCGMISAGKTANTFHVHPGELEAWLQDLERPTPDELA